MYRFNRQSIPMNPLGRKLCQQRLPRFLGFISIASNESVCGILCSLSFYLVGKILTQCLNSELQGDSRRVPGKSGTLDLVAGKF